jgi:uncharacterized protein (TIGR02246 family)
VKQLIVSCLLSCLFVAATRAEEKMSADEQAIRASINSYVTAYNRGDAKAVASHWGETAEWLSPAGKKIQGRAAIEQALSAMFAELKGLRIETTNPTIRFVTADVAIEEGVVMVTRPGEEPSGATYLAIHSRKDGQWKLDSVREVELPAEAFLRDGLDQLEWLVGEWVDHGEGATIESKVAWTKNGAFLTQSFRVVTSAENELEGTQIIGWDPVSRSIRSWMFDTDGGFGQGVWTRRGNRWIVRATQTLADGRQASATSIYERDGDDKYVWQSIDRSLEGEALPDVKPVKVVRAAAGGKRETEAKPAAEKATPASNPPKDPAPAAKPTDSGTGKRKGRNNK